MTLKIIKCFLELANGREAMGLLCNLTKTLKMGIAFNASDSSVITCDSKYSHVAAVRSPDDFNTAV